MIRWLTHIFGLDDPSGGWYLWWSGAGADLVYVGAVLTVWRHLNCHSKRLLAVRPAPGRRYPVQDVPPSPPSHPDRATDRRGDRNRITTTNPLNATVRGRVSALSQQRGGRGRRQSHLPAP